MSYSTVRYGSNKELFVNIDARKIHLLKYIYKSIVEPLAEANPAAAPIEESNLDLCDGDGNLVELGSIEDHQVCMELEHNVISHPTKDWVLVVKDELEIRPLLDKEFWPNRLNDKLNQLRAQAIKNRDRRLRSEQKSNKGTAKGSRAKSKILDRDDAVSTSSRATTSRKSMRR